MGYLNVSMRNKKSKPKEVWMAAVVLFHQTVTCIIGEGGDDAATRIQTVLSLTQPLAIQTMGQASLWYCTAYVILIGMSCRPLDPESDDEVENNGNDTLEEVPF